ncbi:hypothetical protein [Deinococcus sp. YIM 77859]|uniref:hypothetical protein n=1 Tax=Deinococcus sp. YIM 77859 TaxID=1540221 RepID=UPI0012DFF85B|nr:hypothetical protein [Deinococcus sp. YIM 77859]
MTLPKNSDQVLSSGGIPEDRVAREGQHHDHHRDDQQADQTLHATPFGVNERLDTRAYFAPPHPQPQPWALGLRLARPNQPDRHHQHAVDSRPPTAVYAP